MLWHRLRPRACQPRFWLARPSAVLSVGTTESLAELLDGLPEDLRRQAFTHASWVEHRSESYERLAFLGDVVLSLAVSNHLYPRFERYGAGRLTKVRAQAVSGASCARVARGLGVPAELRAAASGGTTGRSAEMLLESERVLASVCEAIIGAAYLAFGFERTAPAVVRSFAAEIDDALDHPVDYKSVLQERLARRAELVTYRTVAEQGPAHDRSFVTIAEVHGEEVGRGEGKTKKGAEQEAALQALDALDEEAAG
jgi:ribonuclease-3